MHTHSRTHNTFTLIDSLTHIHTHTLTDTCTHTHMHYTHAYTHTQTHTHSNSYTLTYTYTHIHTHNIHIYTHTHTHSHTHLLPTLPLTFSLPRTFFPVFSVFKCYSFCKVQHSGAVSDLSSVLRKPSPTRPSCGPGLRLLRT